MIARRSLTGVLLAVVVVAGAAWRLGWLATAPPPPPSLPPPSPPPRFVSVWATEQEWLVDRITRDLREMAALAAKLPAPPADAPPVKPEAVRFEEHLFSPPAYEPLAREALGQPGAARPAAASDSREDARLLSALLDPRSGVLVQEDMVLSRRLEAEPGDPSAHERAALLLGAFALRDCAGRSTDTRPALTRMTAHLALARALRGGAEGVLPDDSPRPFW